MLPDWHQTHSIDRPAPRVVDSRRRMALCVLAFWAALGVVAARVIHLEATQGAAFREEAARPLERRVDIPAPRGRILARDGSPLAEDRDVATVAVHYRYLQRPADPAWLRREARGRLTSDQRREPERIAEAEAAVLADRDAMIERLQSLTGMSPDEWDRRAERIQTRVERIAETVNRRRLERWREEKASMDAEIEREEAAPSTWRRRLERFGRDVLDGSMHDAPPAPITVAEETSHHAMIPRPGAEAIDAIRDAPDDFPGVRVETHRARVYPIDDAAALVLGHLGQVAADELTDNNDRRPGDWVGRAGVESLYDELLHGRRGVRIERTNHSGRVLSTDDVEPSALGWDLTLTIDAALQRLVAAILDDALARAGDAPPEAGAAAVVMDVESGELLAVETAPRFDPNAFALNDQDAVQRALDDPRRPMFDRASRMAIPVGSVMKVVTGVALLESRTVDPRTTTECRGFLRSPDAFRCAVFTREGRGHGEVDLSDALCESCNVYFFRFAERAPPVVLLDWAGRFGFGRRTGVDLPFESPGELPIALLDAGHRPADELPLALSNEAKMFAVGQGRFRATPLQVARMTAAVANGGRLVTPHVVARLHSCETDDNIVRSPTFPSERIEGLDPMTLAAVREGMERVVRDPLGTAHASLWIEDLPVAGKTGTAETGGDRPPHAWFAGYVPADAPRYVVVVALEHGGDASEAACPAAREIILQLRALGHL